DFHVTGVQTCALPICALVGTWGRRCGSSESQPATLASRAPWPRREAPWRMLDHARHAGAHPGPRHLATSTEAPAGVLLAAHGGGDRRDRDPRRGGADDLLEPVE